MKATASQLATLFELRERGATARDMVEQTGLPKEYVWHWRHRQEEGLGAGQPAHRYERKKKEKIDPSVVRGTSLARLIDTHNLPRSRFCSRVVTL